MSATTCSTTDGWPTTISRAATIASSTRPPSSSGTELIATFVSGTTQIPVEPDLRREPGHRSSGRTRCSPTTTGRSAIESARISDCGGIAMTAWTAAACWSPRAVRSARASASCGIPPAISKWAVTGERGEVRGRAAQQHRRSDFAGRQFRPVRFVYTGPSINTDPATRVTERGSDPEDVRLVHRQWRPDAAANRIAVGTRRVAAGPRIARFAVACGSTRPASTGNSAAARRCAPISSTAITAASTFNAPILRRAGD